MMSSMNFLILTDDLCVYAVTSCQDYVKATLFWRQLSESALAIEMSFKKEQAGNGMISIKPSDQCEV